MVVQKAINNLKEGPKEDKVAVAGGIAVSVVAVLLIAWAIFFFRSIQGGTSNTTDESRPTRADTAASQVQGEPSGQPAQGDDTSQFGSGGATH